LRKGGSKIELEVFEKTPLSLSLREKEEVKLN